MAVSMRVRLTMAKPSDTHTILFLDREVNMNVKLLGAIILGAAVASISASYKMRFWPFEPALELSHERFYTIKDDIEQASTDSIIVFGDSIVQGAPLPQQICGHVVVNAGVVGATIEYFRRHAAQFLGPSHPNLIVLAVGINNASEIAARKFQEKYEDTVGMLSRSAPVVVATITPVRAGAGSVGYDASLVPVLNSAIKATPTAKSVIDLNAPLADVNLTTDGIHLGQAGYTLWLQAMVEGIRRATACEK
jgi:lysophospholipase L1-like esterase